MIAARSVVLSLLLMSGVVAPVYAWQFVYPVAMNDITKYGFFGTGVFIGFATHVTARPEDWLDPALVSVGLAVPVGLIGIRNFDANVQAMGCTYTDAKIRGFDSRGVNLALGVCAGAAAGKTIRYTIKGSWWLLCAAKRAVFGNKSATVSVESQEPAEPAWLRGGE